MNTGRTGMGGVRTEGTVPDWLSGIALAETRGPSFEVSGWSVRGTAWYSLATRGLVLGGGVGGGVGRMVHCNSYSDD